MTIALAESSVKTSVNFRFTAIFLSPSFTKVLKTTPKYLQLH